nr:MAG TPA: hypothetical protein [Caudoviricetes sp.]
MIYYPVPNLLFLCKSLLLTLTVEFFHVKNLFHKRLILLLYFQQFRMR